MGTASEWHKLINCIDANTNNHKSHQGLITSQNSELPYMFAHMDSNFGSVFLRSETQLAESTNSDILV